MEKGKINSITIEGVKGEGDYNLSNNKWDLSNSTAAGSYTVSFAGDEGKVEGKRVLTGEANDNKVLMMIPQTLGDGATVTINFTPTGRGVKEASFSLGGTTWEPGRHITYVLSTTKLLNLNMGTITYPDGWKTVDKIKSTYTDGDSIGMYVVDKYNKVIVENLKFTYNDNGSQWTVESGKEFKGSPQYNYFVYYPYQPGGLLGAPAKNASNIDVTSAEKFFADAITEWGKKFDTSSGKTIDQSDIKKMNSFDLQIGKADGLGESGTTINFGFMKHAMGLAEIVLGKKIVAPSPIYKTQKFGKAGVYTWGDKIVYASNNIKGYKPFNIANHKYVTIVRPKDFADPTKLETEESDVDGWKVSLSFSPSVNQVETLEAENKQADADMSKAIEYPIDLGYIFYNDGSISKDLTGQTITSDHCPVGIVVYLAENNDGTDKWAETNTAGSGIGGHGLVMCLKTIDSTGSTDFGKGYSWSSYVDTDIPNVTSKDSIVISKNQTSGSGYTMTAALFEIGSEAATAAKNYNTLPAPSSKCTGWFLPTAGQYYAAMSQLGGGMSSDWEIGQFFRNMKDVTTKINDKLKIVGDSKYTEFFQAHRTWAWTSSEVSSVSAVSVDSGVDDRKGSGSVRFYSDGKQYKLPVRPFLAF